MRYGSGAWKRWMPFSMSSCHIFYVYASSLRACFLTTYVRACAGFPSSERVSNRNRDFIPVDY